MALIRSTLGLDRPAVPKAVVDFAQRRLDDHVARLRQLDIRVEAEFAADRKVNFGRRASDRR